MKEVIHYFDKRLDKLETKVDTLLKFKWQIIGGSVVITLAIQLTIVIIQLTKG